MASSVIEKSREFEFATKSDAHLTLQDYAQGQIENLINELELSQGDRLPSVRELCKTVGVTRATLGNVVTRMINDGVLVSRPQKGIYLNSHPKNLNNKKLEVIYCLIEGAGESTNKSLTHSPVGYIEHSPFWYNLMSGIRNVISDMDNLRLRFSFLEDFLAEADVTPRGRDWSSVGFIILGDPHKQYIPPLIKLNAPIVLVNGITKSTKISNINIDCALGTERVVDHLVELGHTRIAYCGTLKRKHQYNYRKFMGYKRAMQKHDLEIRDEYCRHCLFSMEEGYSAAKALASKSSHPTAILFMNDESAIGAMRGVIDTGLSVPHDISIVGFDNIVSGSFTNPSLTTVSARMTEMGELGMKKLIEFHNTKTRCSITLSPELIIRESTALNSIKGG